jgi:hypothetical protein
MNDQLDWSAGVGAAQELVSVRAVFSGIRPDHKAVPDHFSRFPFSQFVRGKFVDIVLDVPFRGIEPVPINHA